MKKMKLKILARISILIVLLDFILMQYLVSNIKPDALMSTGPESYILHLIGFNILLGVIILIFKKELSILFFGNSIISYLIFSFLWNLWIENHPYNQSIYSFNINQREIELRISENPNTFGIYELDPNPKDSLNIIEMGMNEKKGDSIILFGWKSGKDYEMYFHENKLIGFPESPNEIKLKKTE